MAKVGIFLSFKFDKDNDLHRNFYAQAERGDSSHEIIDYSLNEPYRSHDESAWLKKARAKIEQSDIVIVVIGEDTHNAPGVEKEVTIANQVKKPMFQIRPHRPITISVGCGYICMNGKAKSNLTAAKNKGVDIIAAFHKVYNSVADFEKKHGVKLRKDITVLLTPKIK